MNILMVIPARSGSRRLPDKNIEMLGVKPLLCWSMDAAVHAALELRRDEHKVKILVSTDSEHYQKIANNWWIDVKVGGGLPAPFLRPPEISGDCDTALVIKHALEYARDEMDFAAEYAVTLQPTSPFRTAEDVITGVELAKKHDAHCVFSAKRVTEFPEWMWTQEPGCFATPYVKHFASLSGLIAQDLPVRYIPNGAVYVTRWDILNQGRIYGQAGRDLLFEMPPERSVDIETAEDLEYARWLLSRR